MHAARSCWPSAGFLPPRLRNRYSSASPGTRSPTSPPHARRGRRRRRPGSTARMRRPTNPTCSASGRWRRPAASGTRNGAMPRVPRDRTPRDVGPEQPRGASRQSDAATQPRRSATGSSTGWAHGGKSRTCDGGIRRWRRRASPREVDCRTAGADVRHLAVAAGEGRALLAALAALAGICVHNGWLGTARDAADLDPGQDPSGPSALALGVPRLLCRPSGRAGHHFGGNGCCGEPC